MGFTITTPAQSLAIIGHDGAKQQITQAYESGKMHHAWLLVGAEGIGKASLAYHTAHMILSGGENKFGLFNPEHQAARLIVAQTHPDLFVLEHPVDDKTGEQKDIIPVDEARKIAPFLSMTATYACGRVAIIDEAHTLNRNGQNAILKMIEEPPTGATVILTATTIGALLPTIRSRCRLLQMEPLTDAQLEVVLARLGAAIPAEVDKARLFEWADGSVGKALNLLQTEAILYYEELMEIISFLPTLDLVRLHNLADKIGRKKDSRAFNMLTNLLVDTLRRVVKSSALGRPDPTGLGAKIAPAGRLDKVLNLWESTGRSFATAQSSNLDNKLTFINAVSDMSRAIA